MDAVFCRLQDYSGIVEKSELAAKVKQAASQGPEGQAHTVPVGYAFDPASGNACLLATWQIVLECITCQQGVHGCS